MSKREYNQDPMAVREARQAAGLTKYALAKRLGRARSVFTEIENDTKNATEELLAEMAKVFGCSVDSLRRNSSGEPGRETSTQADVEVPELRVHERAVADDLPELRPVGGE